MGLYSIGVVVFSRGIRNGLSEKVTYKQRSGGLRHADMWRGGVISRQGYQKYRHVETCMPHVLKGIANEKEKVSAQSFCPF